MADQSSSSSARQSTVLTLGPKQIMFSLYRQCGWTQVLFIQIIYTQIHGPQSLNRHPVAQLVNKCTSLFGTWTLPLLVIKDWSWNLSRVITIQSTTSQHFNIIFPPTHRCPYWSLPSAFPTNIRYSFLMSLRMLRASSIAFFFIWLPD